MRIGSKLRIGREADRLEAKKKLRCYLYTRVSTEMQVEGYSLEAQRQRLEKEAKHRGMKVVEVFEEEGRSGKNTQGRPVFRKMMGRIQNNNMDAIDYVLVFKLSRFGRNAADILTNLQVMEDYGINILAVEEGIDSGAQSGVYGKMMLTILASAAEVERENIQVQTMAGRRQKAQDGKWNGGQAPYGYGLKDGVLIVNEEEAEIIRLIFQKFVEDEWSMNGIARWLNDSGYKKHPRQTGTNERFATSFVKGVLDNPVYGGWIAYGRRVPEKIEGKRNEYRRVRKKDDYPLYEGQHEALIDRETWERAKERRKEIGAVSDRRHSENRVHLLSGLLVCPECGSRMYGIPCRHSGTKKDGTPYKSTWYYRCNRQISVMGKACGYKTYIRQDEIDEQVKMCVQKAVGQMDFSEEIKKKIEGYDDTEAQAEQVKRLEEAKAKEEARKRKVLQRIQLLDPADDTYDSMFADLQEIVKQYTVNIAQMDDSLRHARVVLENAERSKMTVGKIQKFLRDVFEGDMDLLPDRTLQGMLGELIECVEIFPKKQSDGAWVKRISFKIPINVDGEIYTDMIYGGAPVPEGCVTQSEVEAKKNENLLPDQSHDETVVLLTRNT